MKLHVYLSTWLTLFTCYDGLQQSVFPPRSKREAAGALHIVNNHAQPIHADVNSENTPREITEKVTAPNGEMYQVKSLRKSLADPPSTVDLLRTIGRLVTLLVLVVSAALEFYPLLWNLYQSVSNFLK